MTPRRSGVLLPISALPSPFGIGDLGPGAHAFVDFLAAGRQTLWQVLPLNPTSDALGDSPYAGVSAFAGSELLLSPERMVADGWLEPGDLEGRPAAAPDRVEYAAVRQFKQRLLETAYARARATLGRNAEFARFCRVRQEWLDDYALFTAVKMQHAGGSWDHWPTSLRDRAAAQLGSWRDRLAEPIERIQFGQFLFFRQWSELRAHARSRGLEIMGDVPIYVAYDSADVWANPELFKLDDRKRPAAVAGVPPDLFSATGQLWGNPVYRWDALQRTGYAWWVRRVRHNLEWFDAFRLDHFRGFVAYWEVPAGAPNAIEGRWMPVPTFDFFARVMTALGRLPLFAEDLGLITPDVREAMARLGFPGMKVLLFAFGGDPADSPYAPHNFERDCVVYTGTHDNNTVRGWFEKEATAEERARVAAYLGHPVEAAALHWDFVRLALASVAATAVIPMQDLLGLGEEARMNRPAVLQANWSWRLRPEQLSAGLAQAVADVTALYGRARPS